MYEFEKLALGPKPIVNRDYYMSTTYLKNPSIKVRTQMATISYVPAASFSNSVRSIKQNTQVGKQIQQAAQQVQPQKEASTNQQRPSGFNSQQYIKLRQQLNLNNMIKKVPKQKQNRSQNLDVSYRSQYFGSPTMLKSGKLNLALTEAEDNILETDKSIRLPSYIGSSSPVTSPPPRTFDLPSRLRHSNEVERMMTSTTRREGVLMKQVKEHEQAYFGALLSRTSKKSAEKVQKPKLNMLKRAPTLPALPMKLLNSGVTYDSMKQYINYPQPKIPCPKQVSKQQMVVKPYQSKLAQYSVEQQFKKFNGPRKQQLMEQMKRNLLKFVKMKAISPLNIWAQKVFPSCPYDRPDSKQFIQAAKLNQLATIRELLSKNQFLIFDYDHLQMTALHWACKKGHRNVALELINTDADLDAEDAVGRTPLYLALDGLHNDIARDLLYHLASPWSTTKISYQTLYQINPQSKKILSTRRKLDILLSMTPPKQRKQIWIEEALKLYVNV